ncbi:MAG: hypothetical protein HY820_25640 [Acidobacteria bacterium]|nr:hypothetical protein [Acidobacteriota bacterium]
MSCRICETRKPRRFCPGLNADICAPCCGTERENTVTCPLDCEYLIEARKHERYDAPDPAALPNKDIRVSEEFLQEHDHLVGFLFEALLDGALKVEGSSDRDLRDTLEALIKTYRTRQSGLIYETRPENPYAGTIQESVNQRIEQFREALTRESGMTTLRDTDILGVLVFLQRIALHWDNKRTRGRSFLSFLVERHFEQMARMPKKPAGGDSPLLVG